MLDAPQSQRPAQGDISLDSPTSDGNEVSFNPQETIEWLDFRISQILYRPHTRN